MSTITASMTIVTVLTEAEAALDDRTLAKRIAERTWLKAMRKQVVKALIRRTPHKAELKVYLGAK